MKANPPKPDIFGYHDYRIFLRDRVEYEKAVRPRYSLRRLAADVKLAPGYLPMVLAGTRGISSEILEKVGLSLGLTKEEQSYLQNLRAIVESRSQTLRLEALEAIQKHRHYRTQHPRELEVHQYLTHWLHVAIREMVNLGDFSEDPKWIRKQLRGKVAASEIQRSLAFLLERGFLKRDSKGRLRVVDKKLECVGSVYQLALGQFHRDMMKLASEALDTVPREERSITGLTFPIPQKRYGEVFKILDKTLDEIDVLSSEAKDSDAIYHVGISLFPITQNKRGKS